MHTAVLTWGTRGDVQPLLALALALAAHGVRVSFGAPPVHEALVRRHGLRFVPLGTPMPMPQYRAMMDAMHREPNPRLQNRALLQQVLLGDLERLYADCLDAARGADLVVGHWLQVGAGLAAQRLGLPWASVTLNASGIGCEQALSSRQELRLRRSYSSWLWGERLRRFRAEQGLGAVEIVAESVYSNTLNLVAMSPHLVPESAQWPPQHRVVGFFHSAEAPPGWEPAPALRDFVQRHGRVVVVTLGSSAGCSIEDRLATVLAALAGTGLPVVVQSLLADAPPPALPCPQRMLAVGDVPHGWLFRHARCVLHHGGAGTTAAVLSAGVPSVVIGNLFDQPYWGQLLAERGLGATPILDTAFDADVVLQRLTQALALEAPCREFAARAAGDGGVEEAVRLLLALPGAAPRHTTTPPLADAAASAATHSLAAGRGEGLPPLLEKTG